MILCFTLTMPQVASWDGKWSGQARLWAQLRTFTNTKDSAARAARILATGSYSYDFGDGWCARVSVREITSEEGRKIKRTTAGFYGYDWMIDSIIRDGKILADHQRSPTTGAKDTP